MSIEFNEEYTKCDSAIISCNDCKGCSKCCENMGDTIVLDPYDIWMITSNLKIAGGHAVTYDILVSEDGPFELTNQNGLVLPSIKMVADERKKAPEKSGCCPFLNQLGRCSIHSIRPGLCRLFPLGRNFYEDHITYFVLEGELGCPSKEKSEAEIANWLAIPDIEKYEAFQLSWHTIKKNLLSAISEGFSDGTLSMTDASKLISRFLTIFYATNYGSDFFASYEENVKRWQS